MCSCRPINPRRIIIPSNNLTPLGRSERIRQRTILPIDRVVLGEQLLLTGGENGEVGGQLGG